MPGSYWYHAPDWDVPISLIMAGFTYLIAPWSVRVLLYRQWKSSRAMLFATWLSVDGCYWLYWRYADPRALEMRSAKLPASLALYGILRSAVAVSRLAV